MADSSFSVAPSRDSMLPQSRVSRRDRAQPQDTSRVRIGSALLAAALVSGALLMAPDQPEQSASICQHYHSEAACRVW
ncbi:MAG: serine protease inhibitor [Synechococcus sp. ChSW.bin.154]